MQNYSKLLVAFIRLTSINLAGAKQGNPSQNSFLSFLTFLDACTTASTSGRQPQRCPAQCHAFSRPVSAGSTSSCSSAARLAALRAATRSASSALRLRPPASWAALACSRRATAAHADALSRHASTCIGVRNVRSPKPAGPTGRGKKQSRRWLLCVHILEWRRCETPSGEGRVAPSAKSLRR